MSSLLGTLPLIVLGILLLVSRYEARRSLILQSNLDLALISAESVDGWLEGNIRALRSLAISQAVQIGDRAIIQDLVERQGGLQPEWVNLFVTDDQGQMIAGLRQPFVNVGDRAYFQQVQSTGQPAVSNLLTSRITGEPIIVVTVPIVRENQFSGIIAATILAEDLRQLFTTHVPEQQETVISLWGSDRRLITSSDMSTRRPGWEYTGTEFAPVFMEEQGVLIADSPLTGLRTLYGFARSDVASWIITAGTPYQVALYPIYRDLGIFIVFALLVLALTLIWSIYSANLVGRRVALLAERARAIGEGRLAEPIVLRTGDELEALANSLNQMAADLATLDRLKSELITMVSHELKTPLTGIRASLDLLTSGALPPDHPGFQETLQIAERQSRRLQDMIDNLINVARLQAGGLMAAAQPVALASIVQASVQQYRAMIIESGLELAVEAPEDLRVMADTPKVTLALNNLLDNAVKFTKQGRIIIQARREGGEAVLTVTDTGIGLPAETRDRLFRQFYQVEPLLTRHAGGVGLGLWVTRAIIEAHGGRVFVESEGPGKGSTFGFTLPLAPEEE